MTNNTSNGLTATTPHALSIEVELIDAARDFVNAAKARSTRQAYRGDWHRFATWCQARGLTPMPATPAVLALYLTALATAGRKVATITRAVAAVSQVHHAAGHVSPRGAAPVQEVLKGIRRTLGVAQTQKAPVLVEDLRAMVDAVPDNLLGLRDRALLLLGFAGGFRRSELVGLDLEDLRFRRDGLEVQLRRSKTDQQGAGRLVGVPFGSRPATCPVGTIRAWLEAAGITTGAVFRGVDRHGRLGKSRLGDHAVARVVKRAAAAAGLDPSNLAGHSLRAGLATSAAKAGKSERAIMNQTGHRSVAMVRRYVRIAELFADNAAADLGL